MSVQTKSQYVYSERKNNVYKPEDTINFYLPPSLALINTKNSYFVFNIKMTGTQYKACVSQKAGIYSLIRSVQITTGDGATVLETLDNYAFLQALKYYYESTETKDNLAQLHEGMPSKMYLGDTSCNQYIDAAETSDFFKEIEVIMPLYLSGCLYRDQIWPNLATNGLRIKIELNNIDTVMQAVTAPLYQLRNGLTEQVSVDGGGYSETTGYAVWMDGDTNNNPNIGDTSLVLKKVGDALTTNEKRVLSPAVAKPTDLFSVGQKIRIGGSDIVYSVTGLALDDGRIEVSFNPALDANVAEDASVNIRTDAAHNDMGFEIRAMRMNVNTVEAPGPWVQKNIIGKINSGKMNFDIDSYTDYAINVGEGSLNNTLPLNARNKRCKAMLSIPQSSHSNSTVTDSFKPAMEKPRSYQYLLYNNILVPDRAVKLNRYVEGNYDATALREQMMALNAAGFQVNTVRDPHKQFFLGRRFALPGYSYDAMGQISLLLNYSELDSALLMHNFMMHKRQIQIKPDGVKVVY